MEEIKEVVEDNALEKVQAELKEANEQIKKLKATMSEKNSEAAEWKRKYNSTLDEKGQAELRLKEEQEQRERANKEMADRLAELERKEAISNYKASYLGMGYSEELAQSSAEAKVNGNDEILFANQRTFIADRDKKLKEEMLKGQPSLSGGKPLTGEDAEKIESEKLRRYFGL